VLTRAVGGQLGGWLSPDIGTVDKFIIDFDILMDGGTATQADGISMAISNDLEPAVAFSEAGRGSGLRVNFDNWDNNDEAPSIEIEFGGERIASVRMGTQAESTLDTDGWWPVHIELTPEGDLTLLYNGELIHDAVNIPDFESISNARVAFGGRTGGANANQFIDNFKIILERGTGGVPVETVPGLIAYWPFDGDLDDAVGDSHGTGQGGDPIAFTGGQFGEGISLDGVDQFVETPVENEEMFDFQDGTGFSISAWFTVDSFSKSWQALIAKGEGNRWRVHRRGGESIMTGNGGNADVPAGGTDVSDGEIHHLVLVSDPDGGEVRLYIDGELESTGGAPAIQSNDNPMMIGENPDARNRTWHGMIDDVGIWDRPITEEEIATIWNDGEGTPLVTTPAGGRWVSAVPDMIAYWPFDSASEIEGDLVVVDLVDGIEGEVVGSPTAAEGHIGGAIDFGTGNADSMVTVQAADSGWLAPASDADQMSVSLWQKLNQVKNSSTFWFRAESAPSNARNFQAHIPWGNNSIFFDTAGCCGGGDTRITKGAPDIDFLEWHHFVFIKNEGHKSIYVDGEL